VYPLRFGGLRQRHSKFIFVDALPLHSYYPPDCRLARETGSAKALMGTVTKRLRRHFGPSVTPRKVEDDDNDEDNTLRPPRPHYVFDIEGKELHYYLSVRDTELRSRGRALRRLLAEVDTMFVHGYASYEDEAAAVYDLLPALQCIYSTALCAAEVPARHQDKLMPFILESKFMEEIDDDVLMEIQFLAHPGVGPVVATATGVPRGDWAGVDEGFWRERNNERLARNEAIEAAWMRAAGRHEDEK
jgi:hypothetical protein